MTRVSNTNLGTDDLNVALGSPFVANTVNIGKKNIIRRLTGVSSKQEANTQVSTLNLVDKLIVGEVTFVGSPSTATVSDFGGTGRPVVAYADFELLTDIYEPSYPLPTFAITSQTGGVVAGDISVALVTGYTNRWRVSLSNSVVGTKTANITVSASLRVSNPGDNITNPHVVATKSGSISLSSTVQDSGLAVTESGTKSASSYSPISVSYRYDASVNNSLFPNAYFEWVYTLRSVGAAVVLGGTPGSTSITFQLENTVKGTTKSASYDVAVLMWRDSTKTQFIARNDRPRLDLVAEYKDAVIILNANTANAKQYANNATVNPYVDLSASFAPESGTTIEWTFTPPLATGTTANVVTTSSTSNNRVGFTIAANTFQLRSQTYTAKIDQKYSNGFLISSATKTFKISGGNWGHEFQAIPTAFAQGYLAQTAITTASTAVKAGEATHTWTYTIDPGFTSIPVFITGGTNANPTLQATLTANTVSNVATRYTVTSTASFDGESSVLVRSLNMQANYLAQTSTLTAGANSTVAVNSGTANATVSANVSTTVANATIQWSKTGANSLLTSNTGTSTTAYLTAGAGSERSESVVFTAQVRDDQNRLVQTLTSSSKRLHAVSFGASLSGPATVSNTGIGVRTASADFVGFTGIGTIALTAAKVSGVDMTVANLNSSELNISTTTDADPNTTAPLQAEATYTVSAQATSPLNVKGPTLSKNVVITCVSQGTAAVLTCANNTASDYTSEVVATTTATVAGNEAGTTIRWSNVRISGSSDYTVSADGRTFTLRQTTVGKSTSVIEVKAEVLSGASIVGTLTKQFTLTAERLPVVINLTFPGTYSQSTVNAPATAFIDFNATSTPVANAAIELTVTGTGITVGAETGTAYNKTRKATLSANNQVLESSNIVATARLVRGGVELGSKSTTPKLLTAKSYSLSIAFDGSSNGVNSYTATTSYGANDISFVVNGATGTGSLTSIYSVKLPAIKGVDYSISDTAAGCYTADATSVSVNLDAAEETFEPYTPPTAEFPAISKAVNNPTITFIEDVRTNDALNTAAEAWVVVEGASNICSLQAFGGRIQTQIGGSWVEGAGNSGAVITTVSASSAATRYRVALSTLVGTKTSVHRYVVSIDGVDVKTEVFTLEATAYKATLTMLQPQKNFKSIPDTSSGYQQYVVNYSLPAGASYQVNITGNGSHDGLLQRISGAKSVTAGTTIFSGNAALQIIGGKYNGQTADTKPYNFDVTLYAQRATNITPSTASDAIDTASSSRTYSKDFTANGVGGAGPYTYRWSLESASGLQLYSGGVLNAAPTTTTVQVRAPALDKYQTLNRSGILTATSRDADGVEVSSTVNITVNGGYTRTGTVAIGDYFFSEDADTAAGGATIQAVVNPVITGASADATYTWSNSNPQWSVVSGANTSSATFEIFKAKNQTGIFSTVATLTIVDPMAQNGSPVGTITKSFTLTATFFAEGGGEWNPPSQVE